MCIGGSSIAESTINSSVSPINLDSFTSGNILSRESDSSVIHTADVIQLDRYRKQSSALERARQRGENFKKLLIKKTNAEPWEVFRERLDDCESICISKLFSLPNNDGELIYPDFQVEQRKIIEGIPVVLDALAHVKTHWMRVLFMITPSKDLDGKTPISCLKENKVQEVERLAHIYGSADGS